VAARAAAPRGRLRRRIQGFDAAQIAGTARSIRGSRLWRSQMGFLDKVKDAAGKAADQAKHATAVGKEKLEDVRLQKKINDLCEEIGALVVAQRRNEAPPDAPAQIDAKVAEIAEIEKQREANDLPGGAGSGRVRCCEGERQRLHRELGHGAQDLGVGEDRVARERAPEVVMVRPRLERADHERVVTLVSGDAPIGRELAQAYELPTSTAE